jgi:hypothetical protein
MRGRMQLQINRRVITDSWRYQDKYIREDLLLLFSIVNQDTGQKYFKVYSLLKQFKPYIISRDEVAFVRILHLFYGDGDYFIRVWGKGKNRGMRNFWDGVISPERKFYRRRTAFSLKPTVKTKSTESLVSGDFIGRFMKTKPSGKWYIF